LKHLQNVPQITKLLEVVTERKDIIFMMKEPECFFDVGYLAKNEYNFDFIEIINGMSSFSKIIQCIHSKFVIHCDIKERNVLYNGNVSSPVWKIIDFGISIALKPPQTLYHLNNAGKIHGTAGYCAPEVTADGVISRLSDIWSLGCLFYKMLTTKLPFGYEPISISKIDKKQKECISRMIINANFKQIIDQYTTENQADSVKIKNWIIETLRLMLCRLNSRANAKKLSNHLQSFFKKKF